MKQRRQDNLLQMLGIVLARPGYRLLQQPGEVGLLIHANPRFAQQGEQRQNLLFPGPEALRESMRNFEKNIGPKLEAAFPRK